jgi:hypothetical protein
MENNYYFWLGEDGEAETMTKAKFEEKIEEAREQHRKYIDVERFEDDGGTTV